jgi:hypothetical protein
MRYLIFPASTLAAGLIALAAFATAAGAQPADCVTGLSLCAQECDQRTKFGNPDRPQCARGCVSKYQTCERIQLLQQSTGGPALNQGKAIAPAQ